MLRRFEVEGFKNFEKPLVFDLTAGKFAFGENATSNSIVKNALIYGYNGSGKSNLGRAIMDITNHLTDFNYEKEGYNNYLNFFSKKDYASFCYTFEFPEGTLRYKYKKMNRTQVFDEQVIINDRTMIDATQKTVLLKGAESLNTDYDATNLSFVKYIFSNTSLDRSNADVIVFNRFRNFVETMLSFSSLDGNTYQGLKNGSESLAEIIINHDRVEKLEDFLRANSIDVKLGVRDMDNRRELIAIFPEATVNFFSIASKGTKSLVLFYTWLIVFEDTSLVIMDEFDGFYHYELTRAVIREVINTPPQTICTTHNTSAISNDLLRPDCYFTIENGTILPFHKITNKELRRAHNLEKMFRAKAFEIHESE